MDASALRPLAQMERYNLESIPTAFVPAAPQTSSAPGLRQQLSRDQWEDLRPLIQRLYMKENRTFLSIAKFLAENYTFRPTRKQFTTKTNEWGFKKYSNKRERRAILPNLRLAEEKVVDFCGRRHKRLKLECWQKGMVNEKFGYYPSITSTLDSTVVNAKLDSESLPEPSASAMAVVLEPWVTMEGGIEATVEPEQEHRVWVQDDEEYRYWPFARWANVDVQGSPKLTRLFENLTIETHGLTDDIECLVLPSSLIDSQAYSKEFVTTSELTHIQHRGNDPSLPWDDDFSFPDTEMGLVIPPARSQATLKAFKLSNSDVWFPSGTQIELPPGTFGELYPFPSSVAGHSSTSQSSGTVTKSHKTKELEYKSQLRLWKRAGIDETHPAVFEVTRRLALALYNQGKERHAETLYRKLLSGQQKPDEIVSIKILSVQLGLVESICDQGRFLEARELHETVHGAITKTLPPHHPLFRRSLTSIIRIFDWMHNFEEKEIVSRQLVQLSLIDLGPKNPATIRAICHLAIALRTRKRYTESEQLQRLVVQLYQDAHEPVNDDFCCSLIRLAELFERQSQNAKAIKLYRLSAEKANRFLGGEHPTTMACNYRLGRVLPKQGLFDESEELLRATVKLQIHIMGENHPDTLCTMNELGKTLRLGGKYQVGAIWLEKAFLKSLAILGPCHYLTIDSCGCLGLAYENQKLWVKAMARYQQLLAAIRETEGANDPSISKIQRWVDELHEIMDTEEGEENPESAQGEYFRFEQLSY